MSTEAELEAMVTALEASGNFKILRKLVARSIITPHDGSKTRKGICLDLETTGLDPAADEIIELAMLPFTYGLDGRIFEIGTPYQQLNQPSKPIPPEIVELTGITDEMVQGQSIDLTAVAEFIADADLIVAHNAGFDRRFAEKLCGDFVPKPWACSMSEVPWKAEGFPGTKLGYLIAQCGLFHNAHRAIDDVRATVEILARALPVSGVPAMTKLLESARRATCRVWAEKAPFDFKDKLKARGYKWNDGSDGRPKSWFADVSEDKLDAELTYLRSEIYQRDVDVPVVRLTALDRFSVRA